VDQYNIYRCSVLIETLEMTIDDFYRAHIENLDVQNEFSPGVACSKDGKQITENERRTKTIQDIMFDEMSEQGHHCVNIKVFNHVKLKVGNASSDSISDGIIVCLKSHPAKKGQRILGPFEDLASLRQKLSMSPHELFCSEDGGSITDESVLVEDVIDPNRKLYKMVTSVTIRCKSCPFQATQQISSNNLSEIRAALSAVDGNFLIAGHDFLYKDEHSVHQTDEDKVTYADLVTTDSSGNNVVNIDCNP